MSTKTSFKRIALVAASALAIAGFSAVPAHAAPPTTTAQTIGAQAVTKALGAVVTGATVTQAITITTIGAGATSATWTATVTAAPTASTDAVTFTGVAGPDTHFTYTVPTNTIVATKGILDGNAITGVAVATLNFTPTVPGDYTISLQGNGSGTNTATTLTLTASPTTGLATATNSISLSKVTSSPKTGAAVEVNFEAITAAVSNLPSDRFYDYVGYLSSYPAGGFKQVDVSTSAPNTDTEIWTAVAGVGSTTASVAESASGSTYSVTLDGDSSDEDYTANATAASATVGAAQYTFTPTVAGTYVLTVWNDANTDGSVSIGEAVQTISITVAAASGLAASATIINMAGPAVDTAGQNAVSDANFTTDTDAVARTAFYTSASTRTNIAAIGVLLLNSDATAASNLHTVTASITGSGLVTVDNGGGEVAGTARAMSLTLAAAENIAIVHVTTDGTVGTGTITISVTDSVTGVTTVVGTRTVTTYGKTSKLAVDSTNFTIGRAGYKTGGNSTTRIKATEIGTSTNTTTVNNGTTTPAFIVKATDSSGNAVVTTADPTIVSSDATVVSGGTCARDAGSADYGSSLNGVGYYNCSFTTVGSAKSGSKATLTIRVLDPADATGVAYLTTTVAVTVGGIATKEVISSDATSYAAGQAMIISIKATDASGNPVHDGAASPAVTASKALGGSSLAAGIYVGGVSATSASLATATAFAPATSGDFSLTATGTDAAATALSATATVEGDQSSSLALDAANAATDAANNAYDEAQNATQAASDALAAVTALAAQVKSLLASVKKLTTAVAAYKKRTGQ